MFIVCGCFTNCKTFGEQIYKYICFSFHARNEGGRNGRPWNGKTALEDGLLGVGCNSRKDLCKYALRVAVWPIPGTWPEGP